MISVGYTVFKTQPLRPCGSVGVCNCTADGAVRLCDASIAHLYRTDINQSRGLTKADLGRFGLETVPPAVLAALRGNLSAPTNLLTAVPAGPQPIPGLLALDLSVRPRCFVSDNCAYLLSIFFPLSLPRTT